MNKELNGRVYDLPEDVIGRIDQTVKKLGDQWSDGKQRANNLLSTKKVNYGQLKRIIHDLKNIDKVNDRLRYDLYGGELMEKWANGFLNGERAQVKNKKMASHRINNLTGVNGVRKNPFLKKHEKEKSTKTPINILKSNSDETSVSPITSVGIFEEVNRIKQIINY